MADGKMHIETLAAVKAAGCSCAALLESPGGSWATAEFRARGTSK